MKKVITALAILISSTAALAGGFGDTEVEDAKAKKQLEERQSYVGLKVYYQSADCSDRVEIKEAPSTAYGIKKYKSAKPVSAIVKEYVPFSVGDKLLPIEKQGMGEYYILEFEDGAVGYLEGYEMLNWLDKDMKLTSYKHCLTAYDPKEKDEYFAAKEAQSAKEAAERKAEHERFMADMDRSIAQLQQRAKARAAYNAELKKKPGASIGMTAQQVINKTNWGRPDKVNRTTTPNGVDEQWVYDGGSYLYFHNGILRAIQN